MYAYNMHDKTIYFHNSKMRMNKREQMKLEKTDPRLSSSKLHVWVRRGD